MFTLRDIKALGSGEKGALDHHIAQICENSPYLSGLYRTHKSWFEASLDLGEDVLFQSILNDVNDESEAELSRSLRIAKGRIALYLAVMDLGSAMDVMDITRRLSLFADFAVERALRFLIGAEVARGKLPHHASTQNCGIFALAMGKQGAYELNYSSDIDLIMFFDETRFEGEDIYKVRKGFIRVVQRLVKVLSENTADGYVFRTDLRLRPDPSVTPVVITTDQAESYYEALGRTWERAAFIKARICAGDFDAGNDFLQKMRPFIWRRLLDFAAIEDAHNMRTRIRSHKHLDGSIELEGHHLKLGRGGIREIEFFTQTRQLIFGGRNDELRVKGTLQALDILAEHEIIPRELAVYLTQEYKWLRRLEHITQMINDQQTHLVPDKPENLAKFLALADAKDEERFRVDFVARLNKIDATMDEFFEGTKTYEAVNIDYAHFGARADEIIDAWMSLPATRSDRAQAIFDRIKPVILEKLSQSAQPSDALLAFDKFLRGLPAGVQMFSMFDANPHILDLLTEICALAPSEAHYLGHNSRVLEAVLSPDFFEPVLANEDEKIHIRAHLDRELEKANDYEDRLNAVRRFVREAQFRVSVHLLRGLADAATAGRAYTMIADLAIEALLDAVNAHMTRRYGPPPGKGAAILAMGKLGSCEMTRHSDLDLVVIYDADGAEMSEGKKPLAISSYFSRFTQNFIQAISVPTSEGALYEVDMRLRPSGRQGPVAVSLKSFADYQLNEAWTWEHMALLRARVVAGDAGLSKDINNAMQTALKQPRDIAKTLNDVREMRQKIRDNFQTDNPLAIKHGAGRMMETELLLQTVALAQSWPNASNSMSDLLTVSKNILKKEDHKHIETALLIWAGLMHLSRLSFGGEPSSNPSQAWMIRQEQFTETKTLDELSNALARTAKISDGIFDEYLKERS